MPESILTWIRPLGTSEWFYWLYDHYSCTNFSFDFSVADPLPDVAARLRSEWHSYTR